MSKEQSIREQTRRSIANLVAKRRGSDKWDDDDYITAGNILFLTKRLMKEYGDTCERQALKKIKTAERFLNHTQKVENGCIEWTASLNKYGYGDMQYADDEFKTRKAHRVSYYVFNGINPGELTVDHTCNNRKCVNPKHMVLATGVQNSRRGSKPFDRIDYCYAGHKLEGDNLRMRWTGKKENRVRMRGCVACRKIHDANYNARKKAKLAELKANKENV